MPSTRTTRSRKPAAAAVSKPAIADDKPTAKPTTSKPKSSDEADAMAQIDGIAPLVLLKDGETYTSTNWKYTLKRTSDHYYCTCIGWKMAGGAPDARTCTHLKEVLGSEYEYARLGIADPGSAPKTKKRKAVASDDEDGGKTGASKKRATAVPKRLKDTAFKTPLLAHKWDLDTGCDPTGWWLSEKLDGVRAIWNGPKGSFYSRAGNPFYAPDWFVKRLPRDQVLDGELFGERGGFQQTVSIVKAQNRPEKWKFSVSYQIFDVPSKGDLGFEERLEWLEKRFSGRNAIKWVHVLPHTVCKGREHLFEMLEEVCEKKGEGVMLREPRSVYVEGRSKSLLKVKRFFDADAIVRAHEKGSGKNSNCTGALRVEMLDDQGNPTGKMFKVGSGLTDAQRRNPPKIGATIIYKYQERSNSGTPRFPTFVGERAD